MGPIWQRTPRTFSLLSKSNQESGTDASGLNFCGRRAPKWFHGSCTISARCVWLLLDGKWTESTLSYACILIDFYRRLLVSQDNHEIWLTIAKYDEEYIQYLRDELPTQQPVGSKRNSHSAKLVLYENASIRPLYIWKISDSRRSRKSRLVDQLLEYNSFDNWVYWVPDHVGVHTKTRL